jgi:hypothetical protein
MTVLLAGCSSNGSAGSVTTTSTAPTTTGVPSPTVATTIPFSIAKNARQDVTSGVCNEVGGMWVLAGMVKNSAKVARTYQIVVDFVTQPGDTVLDTTIVTTASVKPGASLAWSTKSAPGLPQVACVIRQVQAPA